MLADARHVHVASTALQPRLRVGLPDLFRAARAAGATSSFDTNWDPAERWDGVDELLATADICFPNLEEGRRWTGLSDPEAVARALVARSAGSGRDPAAGPITVALKLGGDGATRRAWRRSWCASAPARVAVIDTVGAGDSFDAGFVAAHRQRLAPGRGAGPGGGLRIGIHPRHGRRGWAGHAG